LFDDRLARNIGKDKAQSSIAVCIAVIHAVGFARKFVEALALSREIPSRSSEHFCCLSACGSGSRRH
jgi:hypothetical protein